jgi:hypothetical protein
MSDEISNGTPQAGRDDDDSLSTQDMEDVSGGACMTFVDSAGCSNTDTGGSGGTTTGGTGTGSGSTGTTTPTGRGH